jgi:hypothetical protein
MRIEKLNGRAGVLLLCGALSAGLPGAPALAETFIVRKGAILGRLYLPVRSGRAAQFAAREWREHLEAITGGELETAWRPSALYTGGDR